MILIPGNGMQQFLTRLAEGGRLVAPVVEDGVVVFRTVTSIDQVQLDFGNTASSVKDAFLPQTERLMSFSTRDGNLEITELVPEGKQVVFGARPCDLAALELLDKVFLTGEFTDSYYQLRRGNSVTVGMACQKPGETCFCTSFGLSPGSTRGADFMLYPDMGDYLAEAVTDKGRSLLSGFQVQFREAEESRALSAKSRYQEMQTPLGSTVDPSGVAEKLDSMFESPYWGMVSRRCLACGICTYVCPTCYCFAVTDTAFGDRGVRYRCWDSCKFPNFLLMAGGHNPRPTKKERTRQRFMHKLNYYVHRYGEYLCVGCGRCVEKCPVGLHIAGVISDIRGMDTRDAEQSAS